MKVLGIMLSEPKLHPVVFKEYLQKARKTKATHIQFQDMNNNILAKIKV